MNTNPYDVTRRHSARPHLRAGLSTAAALCAVAAGAGPVYAAEQDICPMPTNVVLTLEAPSTLHVTWEWQSDVPLALHLVTINEPPYDIGSDNPAYNASTTGTEWSFDIDWVPGKEYEVAVYTACDGITIPSEATFSTVVIPQEVPPTPEPPVTPSPSSTSEPQPDENVTPPAEPLPPQPVSPAPLRSNAGTPADSKQPELAATGAEPGKSILVALLLLTLGASMAISRLARSAPRAQRRGTS